MTWDGELRFVKLTLLIPLMFFVFLVLFQLLPLPENVFSSVSPAGSNLYRWAIQDSIGSTQQVADSNVSMWGGDSVPISVYPHATWTELIKLLSYIGVFLVVVNNFTSRKKVRFLVWALVLSGFAIPVFAIAQKFSGTHLAFWFIPIESMPFGPYMNKNHFAGYIGMIIPLAIGLALSGRRASSQPSGPQNIRRLLISWGDNQVGRYVTLLAIAAFMAFALFISLSRGGISASSFL